MLGVMLKIRKIRGLSKVVVSKEEVQRKQTVRVKAVLIVLLRSIVFQAMVLLRVAFNILAGLVSFMVR